MSINDEKEYELDGVESFIWNGSMLIDIKWAKYSACYNSVDNLEALSGDVDIQVKSSARDSMSKGILFRPPLDGQYDNDILSWSEEMERRLELDVSRDASLLKSYFPQLYHQLQIQTENMIVERGIAQGFKPVSSVPVPLNLNRAEDAVTLKIKKGMVNDNETSMDMESTLNTSAGALMHPSFNTMMDEDLSDKINLPKEKIQESKQALITMELLTSQPLLYDDGLSNNTTTNRDSLYPHINNTNVTATSVFADSVIVQKNASNQHIQKQSKYNMNGLGAGNHAFKLLESSSTPSVWPSDIQTDHAFAISGDTDDLTAIMRRRLRNHALYLHSSTSLRSSAANRTIKLLSSLPAHIDPLNIPHAVSNLHQELQSVAAAAFIHQHASTPNNDANVFPSLAPTSLLPAASLCLTDSANACKAKPSPFASPLDACAALHADEQALFASAIIFSFPYTPPQIFSNNQQMEQDKKNISCIQELILHKILGLPVALCNSPLPSFPLPPLELPADVHMWQVLHEAEELLPSISAGQASSSSSSHHQHSADYLTCMPSEFAILDSLRSLALRQPSDSRGKIEPSPSTTASATQSALALYHPMALPPGPYSTPLPTSNAARVKSSSACASGQAAQQYVVSAGQRGGETSRRLLLRGEETRQRMHHVRRNNLNHIDQAVRKRGIHSVIDMKSSQVYPLKLSNLMTGKYLAAQKVRRQLLRRRLRLQMRYSKGGSWVRDFDAAERRGVTSATDIDQLMMKAQIIKMKLKEVASLRTDSMFAVLSPSECEPSVLPSMSQPFLITSSNPLYALETRQKSSMLELDLMPIDWSSLIEEGEHQTDSIKVSPSSNNNNRNIGGLNSLQDPIMKKYIARMKKSIIVDDDDDDEEDNSKTIPWPASSADNSAVILTSNQLLYFKRMRKRLTQIETLLRHFRSLQVHIGLKNHSAAPLHRVKMYEELLATADKLQDAIIELETIYKEEESKEGGQISERLLLRHYGFSYQEDPMKKLKLHRLFSSQMISS